MINASGEDVYCFVTRFNGGSDELFKVRAGYRDSWGRRNGWELVAFTDADDTTRAGVYVRVNFPSSLSAASARSRSPEWISTLGEPGLLLNLKSSHEHLFCTSRSRARAS